MPVDSMSRFSRSLWLMLGVFAAFAVVFAVYVHAEKQIDRANELRLRSYLLADELRQSSDDLTRMARSYVLTGDPAFKRHYQEILDIRDGKQARPLDYQGIYWDLVLSDDRRPSPDSGTAVPLLELMRQEGFTAAEFAMLAQAKTNSDTLTRTEFAAMQLLESTQPASEANRLAAGLMLHDAAYHQAKASIMQPLGEFHRMMDQRTHAAVHEAAATARLLRAVVILLMLMLLYMLLRAYRALHSALGGPLEEVHARIANLGGGDFGFPISVPKGLRNSVMGWLSETQAKLARIDDERRAAETKNQHLTKLYAALSQCNQAIVRCTSEAELFPELCRDAVVYGGLKMAWIGLLDKQGQRLEAVASHGEGTEYLQGLQISMDADAPSGRGPTGTAMREDRPYWCQDFQSDSATAPWHERAARFGWQASASLPLHRNGKVVGAFTLYAATTGAFEQDVRDLLTEMAQDIDHALNGFEREGERQRAQQMEELRIFMLERITGGVPLQTILDEAVRKLEAILPGSFCSILLLDQDGQHLRLGAAPSLPDDYNAAVESVQIGPGVGSCGNTAYTGQRTIVEDIFCHPNWAPYREIAAKAGLGACWSEPILSSGNRVLGTFAVYQGAACAPDGHSLRLLEMAAHFVAIAIERKQADERIQYLAHYDALTGLPNRTQLEDRIRYATSLAKRSNGHLTVMFLDLDNFKHINDTLGHSVGDALLIDLASRLRLLLREEDTVSRLGGDEFILVLPGTDALGATHVAQKLLDAVAQPFQVELHELTVTASIGIALYPGDGIDLESLSKSADIAMYRAKQEHRNGFRFFTAEMQARSARHLQLENALRHALARNQLELHYQPQVALRSGRFIGAEALLRWQHPELGAVSPAEFIQIAEDTGLILPIGEWVLRQAVQQARIWMGDDLPPLVMAVNLSAVQFRHPDLPSMVSRILDEAGLPPEYLELELTEGVATHDPQAAIAVMNDLHERGIRMSIDDFGTGYSSLNYLKKFKVYKLKIDQSFVRDISTDPEDKAIVSAIIRMASSLGLKTIAEGVETMGQLEFLREQECDEVQGYYYSKPLPAAQFAAFIRDRQ